MTLSAPEVAEFGPTSIAAKLMSKERELERDVFPDAERTAPSLCTSRAADAVLDERALLDVQKESSAAVCPPREVWEPVAIFEPKIVTIVALKVKNYKFY